MTPLPEPVCPVCTDQSQEIIRLRQELATRETELRDLRSSQRDQGRVLQESTREVTRAKAKLRRLATQADAASYIAEVEVALAGQRSPPASAAPLLALAQALLDSTAAPFAQGDYAAAMDRAAQAEQLAAVVADSGAPSSAARSRAPAEILLQVAIPLRSAVDTRLRREPQARAPVVTSVKTGSLLLAHAYKGSWMRVETEDGQIGWIAYTELGAR